MAAASRSLATALWRARFASALLHPSYTTRRDATVQAPRVVFVALVDANGKRSMSVTGVYAHYR
jgi:hypothetical protein